MVCRGQKPDCSRLRKEWEVKQWRQPVQMNFPRSDGRCWSWGWEIKGRQMTGGPYSLTVSVNDRNEKHAHRMATAF